MPSGRGPRGSASAGTQAWPPSAATTAPGTPATPAPRPIPPPRRPPMHWASTTCWATWPSGSPARTRAGGPSCAAGRGTIRRTTCPRPPGPGRRLPGTRPTRNSRRAAGGSRMRHSSASASSANPEPRGARPMSRKSKQSCDVTRREFVHASAAAAAALTLPGAPALVGGGRADTLRIGLVGCGGRGTGAAKDCLTSSERVELVAIGDLFPDRVTECRANLARMATEDTSGGLKAKIKLDDANAFSGFDAYQKVIGSKVDVVLLATPPAFRARHLAAAIEAGKHVFMEKPVAVDPVEVRSVIASADLAAQKGLAIVAGTQRRHDAGYRAAMQRIHDGAIGDIVAAQVYWNQGGLWMKPRQPQWSDVEWQIRNWLYFTWLSGDHIVEQHIHNIDVANWALGAHPMKAVGVGGRQWRTDPAYGHIYDHFAIDFEYANGVHVLSMCRQIDGTASHVAERIVGTRGRSDGHSVIEGAAPWSWDAQTPRTNPYVQEHADLIASIRAGKPLNEGRQVAETTLSAIMGREAAYTGKEITWDELLNAEQDLVPAELKFGPMPVAPVAMPGQTVLARSWRSA